MNLPLPGAADLEWRDGALCYDGRAIQDLARSTETPAFVFSESRLRANHRLFHQAFRLPEPWSLRVTYSVKTAFEPGLLRLVAELGAEAEVACEHELLLALNAGFAPNKILLDGPVHTEKALAAAMAAGVRLVKVDSLDQLRWVAQQVRPSSSLAVVLRVAAHGSSFLTRPAEHLSSRFGLTPAGLTEALRFLAGQTSLSFKGLAGHIGSQMTRPGAYVRALRRLDQDLRLAETLGLCGDEMDIGGGFPSPSLAGRSIWGLALGWLFESTPRVPPLERFGEAISAALSKIPQPVRPKALVVEPGRSMVSNAAILITRVMATKPGWVFLDSSRNFVPESLLFATRRFLPVSPRQGLPWPRVNLSGCTLSAGDVLSMGSRLPACEVGDLLVMLDAGAYTLSRANRFTTLIPPAFLLKAGQDLAVWRKRETSHEVVRELESH